MFPQLSERYIDEGFSAERAEVRRCIARFEILRQYNAETEQTELASVICLLELKRMEEAKDKCEQLLKTGVVLFGDILETYVTILVQTNDYEGVIETVEKVLQTKDIMPDQKEKLAQLALFAEGMLNEGDASLVDSNFELDEFTNEILEKTLDRS